LNGPPCGCRSAFHAARCSARQGVGSQAAPGALVGRAWLLDQLVRPQEQRMRDWEAHCFGSLHVDDQLEPTVIGYLLFVYLLPAPSGVGRKGTYARPSSGMSTQ
jgi:hypothetical protein